MKKKLAGLALLVVMLAGCRSGGIDIGMLTSTAGAAMKAARPISDEEEYYVGRAVSARLLATYPLLNDRKLTDYVNLVGQTVALHSDKPYTYGGYHFVILDSREINAFASPGGMIFITLGMVKAVKNEEELAAVLAHEVAHINHRDGIGSIKKARWTEALTVIGTEAARRYGPQELAQLVSIFEGSIDDVFRTLVVNGYGKSQEYSADEKALTYLVRAGYNPGALKDFLDRLIAQGKASGGGLLKTHPATSDRVDNIMSHMPPKKSETALIQSRTRRFENYGR